jgi:hypothetical protein
MLGQISLLEQVVQKSVEEIQDELAKPKTSTVYVSGLQVEVVIANGIPKEVHRVFVSGKKYPDYNDVGWMLYNEIDYCLICAQPFGFFRYKYYCWGCGNLVCNDCSPSKAVINAVTGLGSQRVCIQCFWGQV